MGLFDWLKKPADSPQKFTPPPQIEPEPPSPTASDLRGAFQPNSNTIAENRSKSIRNYRESGTDSWRWMAAHQVRTCPLCLLRDGMVFPVSQDFEPCHEGCRCCSAPVTKSLAEIVGDPSIPDTRPKSIPGELWFAQQPEAAQRSILGDQAFEAWQSSGLALRPYVEAHGWTPTQSHLDDWAHTAKRQKAISDRAAKKYPKSL